MSGSPQVYSINQQPIGYSPSVYTKPATTYQLPQTYQPVRTQVMTQVPQSQVVYQVVQRPVSVESPTRQVYQPEPYEPQYQEPENDIQPHPRSIPMWIWLIPLILALLAIIVSSIWLFTSMKIEKDVEEASQVFKYASENLKKQPIADIITPAKGSACPSGYEPLGFGNFPGISKGCLCNGEAKEYSYCLKHPSDCKKVSSKKSAPYLYWTTPQPAANTIIAGCVKRIENIKMKVTCDTVTETQCNGKYCVPKNTPCPLTKFGAPTAYGDAKAQTIALLHNYFVRAIRKPDTPYVAYLRLTQSVGVTYDSTSPSIVIDLITSTAEQTVCYENNKLPAPAAIPPATSAIKDYPFMNKVSNGCGEIYQATPSTIYSALDKLTTSQVYTLNTIDLRELPEYTSKFDQSAKPLYLLGETRLSFNTKPECHSLANGKENKALEVVDDIEDLWTFEDTLTLVVLIVSVVLLLAIIFYLATKGNTNEEKSRLFTLIFLILCVVILIFSVWVGVKYYQVKGGKTRGVDASIAQIAAYDKYRCFDQDPKIEKAFRNVGEYAKKQIAIVGSILLWLFYGVIILFFVYVIFLVLFTSKML